MKLFISCFFLAWISLIATAQTADPTHAAGIWLGVIEGPGLHVQLRLAPDAAEKNCLLDSIDQKAFGIPCTDLLIKGNSITLNVPAVSGKFAGTLSDDGKTLSGEWSQGRALPLVMKRQAVAITPPSAAWTPPDPALPPVAVADLKAVLDKDLVAALTSGPLAPGTHAAITIGVVHHGVRGILTYGNAKPDSVYEIGSITKTFTGLMLAQMVEQKLVRLNEPVRELLPPGTVAKPTEGAEITLIDLSDQHSSLPRMPDNFRPSDSSNPYADYDVKQMYAFIGTHGVELPPNATFLYSNLGVGLLGEALASRAKKPYEQLLRDEVTGPLRLTETGISLTASIKARFIQGYDADHHPVHAWDLNAFAGAGGIRSTAADMLSYLEAQLHPDKVSASQAESGRTLPAAIVASHQVHAEADAGQHIALNWFRYDKSGSYWHNGQTGGYTSYAYFSPEQDVAVIVLSNTSFSGSFTDRLGMHISQRLEGLSAVSLAPRP